MAAWEKFHNDDAHRISKFTDASFPPDNGGENLLFHGFRGEDVVRGLASATGIAGIAHGSGEAGVVVTARLVLFPAGTRMNNRRSKSTHENETKGGRREMSEKTESR